MQAGGVEVTLVHPQAQQHFFAGLVSTLCVGTGPDCLGPESRYSYAVMCALQACSAGGCAVFPFEDAAAYYTLLEKHTCGPGLQGLSVVVDASCSTSNRQDFLFPGYQLGRMEQFCLEAADLVLVAARDTQSAVISATPADAFYKKPPAEVRGTAALTAFPFPGLIQAPASTGTMQSSEKGMVSIVIPHYNLGDELPQAVESAVASRYENREILLLDDGSTDEASLQAVATVAKTYPEVVVHRLPHMGLARLRNTAAKLAKGEYITFLDADDRVQPDYYTRMTQVLDHWPNVAYAGSWVHFFGQGVEADEPMFCTDLPLLLLRNTITSFAVSRRALFAQFPSNPDEMANGFEDHEVWLSMAEAGYFGVCVPKAMCDYRVRPGSLSRKATTPQRLTLYDALVRLHPALYGRYMREVIGLLQANGPAHLWPNPTFGHREVIYDGSGQELALARQHLENITSSRSYRLVQKIKQLINGGWDGDKR